MPGKRFKGECKIVFIPADSHEELKEETLEYTEETEVSCVQDHAKAHFRRVKPKKTAEQLEAQKQAMLAQIPEDQRKGISDDLLNQSLDMGMVEHLSILSNSTDNNFTGVTFYCDDEAIACNLPHNVRASEIAACAGKHAEVRGDVFVARTFDNEDDFKRLDFTLSEVSSRAAWVKEARAQNERKAKAESANVAFEKLQKVAKSKMVELSPAEAEKETGNSLFKKGDYSKALQHYDKALELDAKLMVAYNNRAMTQLKLGNNEAALEDACVVLKHEPQNVKALLRRATARENLGKIADATQDYRQILELEPSNKAAALKLKIQSS